MVSILSEYQKWIGEWGEKKFPDATLSGYLAHLDLEICDVQEAATIFFNNPNQDTKRDFQTEIADVFILLLGISHRVGFDLLTAASDKHRILKNRTWNPPDEFGIYHHIAETTVAL